MADVNPVLLVHGFASSFARNWIEPGWVDLLRDAGREVLAIDLLGHGDAEKPHDPAAYAGLHEAVSAAIPAGTVVDAVGFSLGAQLLLRVASATPERFDRIVVGGVGRNVFERSDSDAAATAVVSGRAAEGDPSVAQAFAVFARAPGNDPEALAACLRRPSTPLRPDELAGLTRPVLVVLGDRDFAGPADPLVDALPDATFVALPGVDHFGTPKDFGFIDATLSFLGAQP
ncbi:MAG: alpha/beta fold hydrolase [Acidimicrobiaceae bacterium]|nr:alpha/beta fold hydrolase [Acidimicrobiaceae bacterium]